MNVYRREVKRFKCRKKICDEQRCDERTEAENGLLYQYLLQTNPCQITEFFAVWNNHAQVVTVKREGILRRRVISCLYKTRAEITDL